MKKPALKSHCPINFALELFGDRWTLLVVRDVVFYGKRTYGEFLRSEEKIATNILADRLALLVREGILRRVPHPEDGRKEFFVMSDKGLDLIPVLLQIELWSGAYDPLTDLVPEFSVQLRGDFEGICAAVRTAVVEGQAVACRAEELGIRA